MAFTDWAYYFENEIFDPYLDPHVSLDPQYRLTAYRPSYYRGIERNHDVDSFVEIERVSSFSGPSDHENRLHTYS